MIALVLAFALVTQSAHLEVARGHVANRQFDSAVLALEVARREAPESHEARELLVHSLRMRAANAWRRGDAGAAVLDLSRAWQVIPNDPALRQDLAFGYGKLGERLFQAGDTVAAITALEKSIEIDSSRTDVRHSLAAVFTLRGQRYELNGQNLEAVSDYRRALEVDSGFVEAHLLLGRLYYEREDFELARIHLREARKRSGTAVRGLEELLARVDREYDATRNYATLEVSGFVVRFEGTQRPDLFYRILPTLEDARRRASRILERTSSRPITVIIYAGDAMTRAIQAPDWAAGLYDGKVRLREGEINRGTAYLDKVIRHEVAHAVLEEIAPGRCPAWVHEGFAQYCEIDRWDRLQNAEHLMRAITERRAMPYTSLERPFATMPAGTDIVQAYAEAAAAIRYLGMNHSDHALADLVSLLSSGRTPAQAVDSITFLDLVRFQERVHDWVRWEYGRRP